MYVFIHLFICCLFNFFIYVCIYLFMYKFIYLPQYLFIIFCLLVSQTLYKYKIHFNLKSIST